MTKTFDHSGSSFDDFLDEEGTRSETEAIALKRVLAWQIEQERIRQRLTKKEFASRLGTSRSQLDRLLDPENTAIQLDTLVRGAKAIGMTLRIELVEAA